GDQFRLPAPVVTSPLVASEQNSWYSRTPPFSVISNRQSTAAGRPSSVHKKTSPCICFSGTGLVQRRIGSARSTSLRPVAESVRRSYAPAASLACVRNCLAISVSAVSSSREEVADCPTAVAAQNDAPANKKKT